MNTLRRLSTVLIILGSFTGVLTAQTPAEKQIRSIKYNTVKNRLVVVIEMDKDISYEIYTLLDPNRLVVDFKFVKRISAQPYIEVNSEGVLRIRSAIFDPTTYRIVFDLKDTIPYYKIAEVDQGLELVFWSEAGTEPFIPVEKPVQKKEEEVTPPAKKEVERPVTKTPARTSRQKPEIRADTGTSAQSEGPNSSIGITPGLYFMSDEVFKEIYGSNFFTYGAEYTFTLPLQDINSIDVWFGFKTMQDGGLTTFLEEEITLRMTHISMAVRYVGEVDRFRPFIGPGIDYIFYKETYPTGYPVESLSDSILGFHFQVGSYVDITDFLSGILYFKYNMAKTTKETLEINLGGPGIGFGLSYRFNL